jgi:hypothetical protein
VDQHGRGNRKSIRDAIGACAAKICASPAPHKQLSRAEESFMDDVVVERLVVDLLEWLAERDRTYEEMLDARRTSCPRLPIWED